MRVKMTLEEVRAHEDYVQIRLNTQKIELAQRLLESVTTPGKEDVQKKLELLRQVNHSEFCRMSDKVFWT